MKVVEILVYKTKVWSLNLGWARFLVGKPDQVKFHPWRARAF